MNYKKDCFAFIKEHPTEGCSALTKCECENCAFYTLLAQHEFNLLRYPFNENYEQVVYKKNNF